MGGEPDVLGGSKEVLGLGIGLSDGTAFAGSSTDFVSARVLATDGFGGTTEINGSGLIFGTGADVALNTSTFIFR